MRTAEKSAEAVVAKKLGESPAERRAEEPRDKPTVTADQKRGVIRNCAELPKRRLPISSPKVKTGGGTRLVPTRGNGEPNGLEENGTRRR